MKKREPTEFEKTSAGRIRQLIEERCDGSQQIFADKVGIGKASVSQYVNETNFPNNKTCGKIAKAFGVSPMWVMGFEDSVLKIAPFAIHDTITTSDGDEYALLTTFRELNKSGKNEVIKRAYEVSRLPEYTEKSTNLLPVAAHSDDESPDHLAEDAEIVKQAAKKK